MLGVKLEIKPDIIHILTLTSSGINNESNQILSTPKFRYQIRYQLDNLDIQSCRLSIHNSVLTFHHQHVNINGTDRGLLQSLSFDQQFRNIRCFDTIIRLSSKCHYLPKSDTWKTMGCILVGKTYTTEEGDPTDTNISIFFRIFIYFNTKTNTVLLCRYACMCISFPT